MDFSQHLKGMFPPPCGVTVTVDFDNSGRQKLSIQSQSNGKSPPSKTTSIPIPPPPVREDISTDSSTTSGSKSKRLECIGNHFPELMPEKVAKICFVCSYVTAYSKRKPNGRIYTRHETRYWCPDCKVPLCIAPRSCFRRYHTEEKYFIDIEENLYA